MNRVLLICNAVLALFLAIRLVEVDTQAAPLEEAAVLRPLADDVRIVDRQLVDKRIHRLTLDFGAPLVGAHPDDDLPADGVFRVEPETEVQAYWRTDCQLVMVFPAGLKPAWRHSLHLDGELRAEDGRVLAAGAVIPFESPSVALRDLVVDGEDAGGPTSLLLAFDLPVGLEAARKHLRLRPSWRDELLPVEIEQVDHPDDEVFRLSLASGEFPDEVELEVDGGLTPLRGEVPMGRGALRTVVINRALRLTQAKTVGGEVRLRFNHTVAFPAEGLVSVEPAVPFQTFSDYNGLRLVGDFEPGALVSVTLAEGFPGKGRTVLRKSVRRSLLVPDRSPQLRFVQRGKVLSILARPELHLASVNVPEFKLQMRRVYPNNVVRMLQGGRSSENVFAPGVTRSIVASGARNDEHLETVDLRELLGEAPRGLYEVRLWAEDHRASRASKLIQVTDLGVSVRATEEAMAVQVVGIARGDAQAGVRVTVVTPSNQPLVIGETDADGVVVLPMVRTGTDATPYLVRVEKDGDVAFVDLGGYPIEVSGDSLGGRPWVTGRAEAWVSPSRGIVRPGECIEATVLVRGSSGAAAVGNQLEFRWVAPSGRVFHRAREQTPGSGLCVAKLQTEADTPSGSWRIEVVDLDEEARIGSGRFRVEAFVPNRLESEIEVSEPLRFGASGVVFVRANWLDGAPASGRPVKLWSRLSGGRFVADGYEGFSFDARQNDRTPPGAQPVISGVLDERGEALLRFALPDDSPYQVLDAFLTAEVLDPSGRAVRASMSAPVLRPDLHLGVRALDGSAEIVTLDADGQAIQPDGDVRVQLEHRTWRWRREARGPFRWRWNTTIHREVLWEDAVTLIDGRARVDLPDRVARRGWLVAVARLADRVAEQSIGRAPERPDRLRVSEPEVPVRAGEVARISVEAPCAGRGFVVLESTTVHAARVVELQKGHNTVEIEVPADVRLPNLHVVVTCTRAVARGAEEGPHWIVGGAAVPLLRDDLRVAVSLDGPEEVEPESEVRYAVHAPGASRAAVALVDEGVLGITAFPDPDPLSFFLARRRLTARGADTGAFLMERMSFDPSVGTGGGGGMDAAFLGGSINTRIRPVALFSEVSLDSEGRGEVAFTLPQYEGRLRAMVVAAGPRVLGAHSGELIVRAPLGLQLALPRMVMPGDRVAVPVTVKNNTDRDGEVELEIQPRGGLAVDGPLRRVLAVPAGRVVSEDVWLGAGTPVDGTMPALAVHARLREHERQVVEELMVREAMVFDEELTGLVLEGEQEVVIPENWQEPALELQVGAGPDLSLRPGLESLIRYPYGCLEQTTSRCMALLACRALLPAIYGVGSAEPPQVDPLLYAGIDRIFAMQTRSGGFGWWPGHGKGYDFGTVHALDFLLAARDAGFDLPAEPLAAALDRLDHLAARGDLPVRCHAIEVLSRAGRPVQPHLDWLTTRTLGAEERARLALALARLGHPERAIELLERENEGDGDDLRDQGGLLRSPLRVRALTFRAWIAAKPTRPQLPVEATTLVRAVARPRLCTTQENGQVLRALAEYFCVRAGTDEPLRVTVRWQDRTWNLGGPGSLELPVPAGARLQVGTTGRAYAILRVAGMRRQGEPKREVVGIERSFHDLETGAPATEFRRGRLYEVRLHGRVDRVVENLMITDLLPGGFEPESPAPGTALPRSRRSLMADHIERRDDRVLLVESRELHGEFELRHCVRAVFPGRYRVPSLSAEAMYDPAVVFESGPQGTVEILP